MRPGGLEKTGQARSPGPSADARYGPGRPAPSPTQTACQSVEVMIQSDQYRKPPPFSRNLNRFPPALWPELRGKRNIFLFWFVKPVRTRNIATAEPEFAPQTGPATLP